MKSSRKVIAAIFDYSKMNINNPKEAENNFINIEKAPTFPSCNERDKDCFSKNIQKHFAANFNADLLKTLGLESGRKRVFIGFKIDSDGNVLDINVKAPHKEIKNKVIRVISFLPKMTAGEQDGKNVAVKFSIPFSINIE